MNEMRLINDTVHTVEIMRPIIATLVHHMIIFMIIIQELKCSGGRQTYDEV